MDFSICAFPSTLFTSEDAPVGFRLVDLKVSSNDGLTGADEAGGFLASFGATKVNI